jgi:3',5'-cyclic AMP phosphodiesterase CpdA
MYRPPLLHARPRPRPRPASAILGTICTLAVYVICPSASADPAPSAITVGPYVQDLRPDAFTVVFETATETDAIVQSGAQEVSTHGVHHEARLTGLLPGARVRYRVLAAGEPAASAPGGEVATPDHARPLTFVVYGDTHDGGDTERQVAEMARALGPDLVLHTGDLVMSGGDLDGWRRFFAAEAPLIADVPLYPAVGNHELDRDPAGVNFRRFFALPDGGRTRRYYSFRFGPARFVMLDGNSPDRAQTAWLGATLLAAQAEPGVEHVFVAIHQPPLSVGGHCGSAVEQAAWVELFERHRVRAVFAGHDHAYERLERRGVRYFVAGGGGAPTYAERDCAGYDRAARRVYLPVHHLLRVRVSGPSVEVTALPVGGAPPIETVAFAAGEPTFAVDAPPIVVEQPRAWRWTIAAAALALLAYGGLRQRRRSSG